MRTHSESIDVAAMLWRWVFLIGLVFMTMGTANAVDYFIFGTVQQVSTEDAADNTITDDDLTGDGFPFVRVRVFDQGTGSLLGEVAAGQNGQYTVTFSLPMATPAPRIEVRAYEEVDGGSTQLTEAREGINFFPKTPSGGISTGQLALVKIASDDILEYGAGGFRPYPGVGLVFTRVGKVEIPEISQTPAPAANPAGGLFGIADITSAARATELGVPQFRRSPFAKRLLMFGDFGLPGGVTCPGNRIDWYQVNIEPVDHTGSSIGSAFPWQEHMSKRRTQVTVLPTLDVQVTTQKIGPFNGFLDGTPGPGVSAGTPVPQLYWVNRNEVGMVTNTFYSFPDLRVNWVSNLYNGFYKLSLVYYQEVGRTGAGEPILHELPMSQCFTGGVPSGDADDVALHQLYVRVNNQPLTATFNGIFLRNRTTGNYYAGEGNPDVASKASAVDFNEEALCDIMELQDIYDVEVGFTARHEGGFLRRYRLNAESNDRTTEILFAEESYADNSTDSNPIWHGTPAAGIDVYMVPNPTDSTLPPVHSGTLFDHRCAYDFDLGVTSRLQNGYNWVQWKNPERAYYVEPTP